VLNDLLDLIVELNKICAYEMLSVIFLCLFSEFGMECVNMLLARGNTMLRLSVSESLRPSVRSRVQLKKKLLKYSMGIPVVIFS
jgi:hypothetical protein